MLTWRKFVNTPLAGNKCDMLLGGNADGRPDLGTDCKSFLLKKKTVEMCNCTNLKGCL